MKPAALRPTVLRQTQHRPEQPPSNASPGSAWVAVTEGPNTAHSTQTAPASDATLEDWDCSSDTTWPAGLLIKPLRECDLDALLDIEQTTYAKPWTRGNFTDALKHDNWCELLWQGDALMGYFVAMKGHQEVHLLNITVHKDHRAQGLGLLLLNVVLARALQVQAQWIWLEVRVSNARAIAVYERFGFRVVGERKNYYPLSPGVREHAKIMSRRL